MIRVVGLFVLICLISLPLQAQQTLTLHENLVTNEVPSLWNITLATNNPREYEEIQLKLTLANANEKTIYEVVSPDILLSSRQVKTLNPGLGIAQTLVNDLNGSTLPDGRYEVTYRESISNRLLKQRQFTVNGTNINFTAPADADKLSLNKWINTTGTARLTTAYSNPQGLQSEQKPFYNRFEASPTVILAGAIPISANVLLSTEQNPNRQPMAQASLNFDCNYARALAEQKAMNKIESMKPEELSNIDALKEKYMNKKNHHFDEWKEKLASPDALQQLAQAEAYEKLKHQSDSLAQATDPGRLQELMAQYQIHSLEELEARQDGIPEKDVNEMKFLMTTATAYDDAQAQMEQLKSTKEKAEKLLAQREKIAQLESTSYLQMLRDPRFSRKTFRSLGLSNPGTTFIGGIKSLGVGTTYPLYTPLTMNGTRVKGLNIEWNPAILYMAFTKGTIHNQHFDTTANNYLFERNLLAARLGIGKKNGTHIIATYIKADDQGSPFTSPKDSAAFTPTSNLVIGTDLQLTLFKKRFVTQAEVNAAATTMNAAMQGIALHTSGVDSAMEWLAKIKFVPNGSTRYDIAYSIKSELHLFKDNTILTGTRSYVGPNYTSYGTPFLMTDQLKYEVKANQSIWKKRINLGGFYKYYRDSLVIDPRPIQKVVRNFGLWTDTLKYYPLPSKSFATTLEGFGAEVTLNIPKLPSIWAKYLPVSQTSTPQSIQGQPQTPTLASAMSLGGISYNYKILKLAFNTQIQLSRYDIQNSLANDNIRMNSAMLMQTLAFSKGINCTATGFYNQAAGQGIANQTGLSLATTALLKKKIMTGLEVHHLAQGPQDTKTGATLNANYRIMKNLSAQLRVTMNTIHSQDFGNRKETYGNLVLNWTW